MRDTQLLRIPRAQFESLVARRPQAMLQVTRLIADRLSDMAPMAVATSSRAGGPMPWAGASGRGCDWLLMRLVAGPAAVCAKPIEY
ncbi:hypothetical protein [Salinisphaera sp.]|uniref:hypothetical protein n=1 Tax=Salinisphaera sp. TaxID=1914330 RepID=UPI002D79A9B1|nr:hypothetical protein [Salinisphaera sp.]HET7314744.1 hypothetical protein [Salinisphaera sp.]